MNHKLKGKVILINKTDNQIRVVCVDEQGSIYNLEIEYLDFARKLDCIYNATVISIVPSLQAAFVDFGSGRNGFLPLKQIASEYYPAGVKIGANISEVLREKQKVLVQVEKEETGNKGAALTTMISLAGSYLVLMPNNPRASGISRQIDGEERRNIREIRESLNIPEGMGIIIRTAGIGKTREELQWDLDVLVNLWHSIKQASDTNPAPCLIHQESDAAIRTIKDHLQADIQEILVDDVETYNKVKDYITKARPTFVDKIKFYENKKVSLFSYYQVESQIELAHQRTVRLPSGGVIVIDRTEALTGVIDVNSAQATAGSSIEETAFKTNLEAAQEIARQLRLRDLGGLFVIDFIDMEEAHHRAQVEERLRDALKSDRARTQIGNLSSFGLLEMSRQRLRPELSEAAQITCPRCHGQGAIRSVASLSASILHLIEENVIRTAAGEIQVQAPIDVATYLLNEKRAVIEQIQQANNVTIVIIPNQYMEIPDYEVKAIAMTSKTKALSYTIPAAPSKAYNKQDEKTAETRAEPVVKGVEMPTAPGGEQPSINMITKLLNWLAKLFAGTKATTNEAPIKSADDFATRKYRGKKDYASTRQRPSKQRDGRGDGSRGRDGARSGSDARERDRDNYRRSGGGSSSRREGKFNPRKKDERAIYKTPTTLPPIKHEVSSGEQQIMFHSNPIVEHQTATKVESAPKSIEHEKPTTWTASENLPVPVATPAATPAPTAGEKVSNVLPPIKNILDEQDDNMVQVETEKK